jgi:high affinity sulfate transporter 1
MGLYTILIPLVLFALLGSSRHLVVGADSATAAIMAAGLTGLAAAGSAEYVGMAGVLAIMVGGLLIVARLVRLGFIADFLSRTVLIGFLTGVGIQVAAGQVGGMLGVTTEGDGTIEKLIDALRQIPDANGTTVAVSLAVIALVAGGARVARRVPWALIAVVGSIAVSYGADLAADGVALLGPVPGGLPSVALPEAPWADMGDLLGIAVSMMVVILAQSAATSRAYAAKYGERLDENRDLVGLGVGNAGAALTGAFVVNGSPTKTQMVDGAGGRSQVAQLTCAAVVLVVLLFLTGPLEYLPNAVLAAVVFLIGIELVDLRGMAGVARRRRDEFAVALITAAVVVVWGVEQGIILAIVLSVVVHLSKSYRPHNTVVARTDEGRRLELTLDEARPIVPGLVIYRFNASMYYANAERLSEEALALVAPTDGPPVRWLCLDAAAVGDVDYSASDAIRALHSELAERGVRLVLARLLDPVRTELARDGIIDLIGPDAVFRTVPEAIAAYQAGPAGPGAS